MANNWNKASSRKSAGQSGDAVKTSNGSGGYSYPIKTKKDAQDAATLLKIHGSKYSPAKRAKIASFIRRKAKALGANVNLADADIAQAGNTLTQSPPVPGQMDPNQAQELAQRLPTDPNRFIATANTLQIGQSFGLPDHMCKVKRLASGFQLYSVDGKTNKIVKTLPEVHSFIKKEVKKYDDSNQPPAGQQPNPVSGNGQPVLEASNSNGQGNRLRRPANEVQSANPGSAKAKLRQAAS